MSAKHKANDTRWWRIWVMAGAVSPTPDEYVKVVAMRQFKSQLERAGFLSQTEIEELVQYEFITGPVSVEDQVRRYYLQLKNGNPVPAEKLLAETAKILVGAHNLDSIKQLCFVLHKYWSGFLIHFKGQSYTISTACGFETV